MATATIQVAYEAETSSLKATVNEINQINDKVVEGAQESAKKVKGFFANIANSFTSAFSGGEVKKTLDNQAKAIDNLGKSGKSLTGQLRGLKQELANLEIAGQDGTAAFNQLLVAAAKLEDQIGDTRARVKILASDTFKFDVAVQATQGLAAGFEVAQGAAALFGGESENLQKQLLKVQAATAIANGVSQIANLIKEESFIKTALQTTAETAYGIAVGKSTGALRLLRIALAATGVGLLVFGLIALVENFDKVKKAIENAVPGFDDIAKGVGKVIDKTKEFFGIDDGGAKSKAALDNLIGAEKRKTEFQVAAIDRRINILKAENKDTAALEIEKEQIQIASLKRQRQAIKDGTDELIKLDIEGRKEVRDTGRKIDAEILDRENAIQVLRIQNARTAIKTVETLETKAFKGTVNRKEEELKLNTTVTTAYRDQLNEQNALRVATLEAEKAVNGESLQNTIDTIKAKAKAESDALGTTATDSKKREKINADADKAITQVRSDETNKQIALLEQYAAEVSNILGSLNEISQAQSEKRIADIESASAAELEAINASSDLERDKERSRAALAKRTAQAIAAEKTKQARQDKALALFEIGINTAKGVISALALTPPNPILAAFIAAAGLTQAAAVAAKPIPKFEKGGLIGGKLHSQGGTLIEAEQGEYMVNRRQSAKHRRELDAMNTSTEAFRRMIDEKYVRPALMGYSAGRRGKEGVVVNASLNSKSMEKKLDTINKSLKNRNVVVNINQQDSRYTWQ
jgi:hypothetical protein